MYSRPGSKVDTMWLNGQREEARRRSMQARNWNILGMVIGVVLFVLTVVLIVVGNVVSAANASSYN